MFALNPLRFTLTATTLEPEPIDCVEVGLNVDSVLLVPYSNHMVVAEPFGFTLPLNVDELDVTELAAVVVTAGRPATVGVVKLMIPSLCVPALFCAAAR